MVDAVSDILTVAETEIKAAPTSAETGIEDEYVNGLISQGDKMVILLDVDYLFDKKTLSEAASVK